MLELQPFVKGLLIGIGPGLLCKIISGIPARMKWESDKHRRQASQASIMTRGGVVQPIQYLVGMAMVARGEFAFLVALSASNMKLPDGESYMLSKDVYAAVTWALARAPVDTAARLRRPQAPELYLSAPWRLAAAL